MLRLRFLVRPEHRNRTSERPDLPTCNIPTPPRLPALSPPRDTPGIVAFGRLDLFRSLAVSIAVMPGINYCHAPTGDPTNGSTRSTCRHHRRSRAARHSRACSPAGTQENNIFGSHRRFRPAGDDPVARFRASAANGTGRKPGPGARNGAARRVQSRTHALEAEAAAVPAGRRPVP